MNALKILREEGLFMCIRRYTYIHHIYHTDYINFKAIFVIHAVASCGNLEHMYK